MTVSPLWDLDLVPIGKTLQDVVGVAVESPPSLSGVSSAIDVSGGGLWSIKLQKISLFSAASHKALVRYSTRLNGGVRSMIIPLRTEILMPLADGEPSAVRGIRFAGGIPFAGGSTFVAPGVIAEMAASASAGAGTVSLLIRHGGGLLGGEVFSIRHPTKEDRAYRIGDIDEVRIVPGGTRWTVAIRPTLRDVARAGQMVRFWRPRIKARLPAKTTMPWTPEGFWRLDTDVTLIEDMS